MVPLIRWAAALLPPTSWAVALLLPTKLAAAMLLAGVPFRNFPAWGAFSAICNWGGYFGPPKKLCIIVPPLSGLCPCQPVGHNLGPKHDLMHLARLARPDITYGHACLGWTKKILLGVGRHFSLLNTKSDFGGLPFKN
jgi:hypothetical protein